MPANPDPLQVMFDALRRMHEAWPGGGWSWDGRFSCVASTFSIEIAKRARAAAKEMLTAEWTDSNIGKAPVLVQDIAKKSGGIRSGQVVFSSEAQGGIVAFGLWWPWDNQKTISLRVGLLGGGASIGPRLRTLFSVSE